MGLGDYASPAAIAHLVKSSVARSRYSMGVFASSDSRRCQYCLLVPGGSTKLVEVLTQYYCETCLSTYALLDIRTTDLSIR
jgi:hypothetical protein